MANEIRSIEPVDRESTVSIIARRLRSAIAEGVFVPGSQLTEAELASQLRVSRGPLREAMQRLVQEGLLRPERNRGLFVPVLGDSDLLDIYFARGAIERAAVAKIHERDDPELLLPLHVVIAKMHAAAKQSDWRGVADLDLEFHKQLVTASGSPRLDRMFGTLLVETRMCIGAIELTYAALADLVEVHEQLLGAVSSRELAVALAGTERHIAEAVERVHARPRLAP
jgi:DNA-binding GntR family transcriptional regulator